MRSLSLLGTTLAYWEGKKIGSDMTVTLTDATGPELL